MTDVPRVVLLDRQKHLLSLLHALGGAVGNLDFQKLLLLYCAEQSDGPAYEFVPYRFGGFSFTSYSDRRKLVDRGLLLDDEHSWRLSGEGRKQASRLRVGNESAVRLAMTHQLRGDLLVAETYRRFPYYAIRSEIADRVLSGDSLAMRAIERAQPKRSVGVLLTIGYEGRTIESYLNLLLKAGATLLCDVRRNPISRKYGFSKKTLSNSCRGVGIGYMHLPELGVDSEKRAGLVSNRDYERLFDEYKRWHLPKQQHAIAALRGCLVAGETMALTCYELDPEKCHRHCVADTLTTAIGESLEQKHL